MKVYRLAVLVAILILATPGTSSLDSSQQWGSEKPGDLVQTSSIKRLNTTSTYKALIKMPNKINSVKFMDVGHTGPTIWLNKRPPCHNPEVTIKTRDPKGFFVIMDVFYEK